MNIFTIQGIESDLKAAYCFNVAGYDYPILLLLSQNGTVTYVNTEEGYKTGNFAVTGRLSGIPEIEKIYETTVEAIWSGEVSVISLAESFPINNVTSLLANIEIKYLSEFPVDGL